MWYVILRYVINFDLFKEIFTSRKRGVTRSYAKKNIIFQSERMVTNSHVLLNNDAVKKYFVKKKIAQ